MFKNKRQIRFIYLVLDIFLISISFYLPYKYNSNLVPLNSLGFKSYFSVFAIWGLSIVFLLNNFQLYFTDRALSIIDESWMVIRCILFSSILTALFIFALKIDIFSRLVFVETVFLLIFTLPVWRAAKRIYVRQLIQKGYSNYNVLIAGAGKAGTLLSEEIRNTPYLGIRIIGFVDDVRTGQVNGFQILGKIKELETLVKKYFIDEIYVTIPSERKVTSEILLNAIKLRKTVRIVAERFSLGHQQIKLNHIGYIPVITYFENGLHGSEQGVKRIFDVLLSGLVLIFLSPLFLIIVFMIKLDSPGPVLYVSKRSGKKNSIFNFYKFRSMVFNADDYKDSLRHRSEVTGPIFKIRDDPRITRFGKILRKYSLDELPQLINVFKGDMSLVGPRPFPVDESQKLENKHLPRLNIKPGITGMAQINGRSDLSFHQWARWDLWYFNHWSLGLDLRILWWTLPAVLKGKGAY